jgi:hypothetical protein
MLDQFGYTSRSAHVFNLAEELKWQGISTTVVITGCPSKPAYLYWRQYQYRIPVYVENRLAKIKQIAHRLKASIIHAHTLCLLPHTVKIAAELDLPFGLTVHHYTTHFPTPELLQQAAFVLTPLPIMISRLQTINSNTFFIPEGINLEEFQPAAGKAGFKVTFIGEDKGYNKSWFNAFLKAAGLADLYIEIVSPEPVQLLKGRFHGWSVNCADLMRESQVVVGRNRALLEGMACGTAAMILGLGYGGIVEPRYCTGGLPDLNGSGNETAPCYRTIFYDLARLLQKPDFLRSLQDWGRKYAREHCDLHLVAEKTTEFYRRAIYGF